MDRALTLQEVINPFRKIYVWKKMVSFLGSQPVPLQHMEWIPNYSDNFIKKGDGDGQWHVNVRIIDPYGNVFYQGYKTKATKRELSKFYKSIDIMSLDWSEKNFSETSGTNDFEAGLYYHPKRTRQHKTMEEANLACLLPKQIYASIIVDWEVMNNMGYAEAIEEMLEIKVYEMGGYEEIFTYEAWRHAFDIREPVYAELCHKFYATYEFDETITDEELMSRKVIKFRSGARRLGLYSGDEIQNEGFENYFCRGLRNDDHFNVNQYWLEISSENALILSRSSARTIRKPILRVLQKMITYGLCQRTTRYDKVQRNEHWLMSMFEAINQNGYAI
ncbi:hypothetical protein Tco_0406959 [Tanacetum coccineum]